ncbi:MAG: thioredoxin domain-containing protein [Paenibacillaceae bacterium]
MENNEGKKSNRLIHEKSPYLLQHSHNPVNWFPWGEEAFTKAAAENKPIFLSIGYSTCHWCHVMERESFEDVEVAELLNEHYVAIKVDREERPDVDHLYMTICQAMTGHGGWPLTAIMTADRKPFFTGTYFPKQQKHGRIGLMEILSQLNDKWLNEHDHVVSVSENIVDRTKKQTLIELKGDVNGAILDLAFEGYASMFDPQYGGFGNAPKFPTSHNLSFLLCYAKVKNNAQALSMVEKTLDGMHRGGMYDHVGFGFSRYSTDERWLVPHFEKMLYDNALLAITYTEAYQVTGTESYATIADQIFTYVLRDMTGAEGGFYCAEDADSEGEEGKFYVWTSEEVIEVLGIEEGTLINRIYDITDTGNFEEANIPNLLEQSLESYAVSSGIPLEPLQARVSASLQKLFIHREARIHPYKDDKILTSWNGLMIAAFAIAARAFDKSVYADAAERATDFMMTKLRREDGRLLARYRDGESAFLGYVDDYAFMVWALIELYETTFNTTYLQQAIELNEQMVDLFWDQEKGGLFFYGHDAEQLFTRNKETYDGAVPSGNSVAAMNMIRLARMTGDSTLEELFDKQVKACSGAIERYPSGHSIMLIALLQAYEPSREIVIAGAMEDPQLQQLVAEIRAKFLPNTVVMLNPDGELGNEARKLMPVIADKTTVNGQAAVYICENYACQAPITELEQLVKAI